MTTSKRQELERRMRVEETVSPIEDLARSILAALAERHAIRFPSPKYHGRPVEFCQEILGFEPWSLPIYRDRDGEDHGGQREVLEALAEHDRVAWKSGRRVSKSHTVAAAALWWYSQWDDARTIMTSVTEFQVESILWRQVMILYSKSGRCVSCKLEDPDERIILTPCPHSARLDGDLDTHARTGLHSVDDFREVIGFTAKEAKGAQGLAGPHMLFLPDEAGNIPQPIFDALEGNRAGGAKVLLTGNPNRTVGEFYEAFTRKKKDPRDPKAIGYRCITTSSEETPNVTAKRIVIPGLATMEFIAEREKEWGKSSPLYKIHVEGKFASNEDGQIFPIDVVAQAEMRWHEATLAGRLFIGLDPSGPTGSGDEGVFAVRRGMKLIAFHPFTGLDAEGYDRVLGELIAAHAVPREIPVVIVDSTGPVGADVHGRLAHRKGVEVYAVNSSNRAMRKPHLYVRVRDELVDNFEKWLAAGGAIPEDVKLAEELNILRWETVEDGRVRVTRKKEIRKVLGRSPDRFDAGTLSVWEPLALDDDEQAVDVEATPLLKAIARGALLPADQPRPHARSFDDDDDVAHVPMNHYAARSTWRRR